MKKLCLLILLGLSTCCLGQSIPEGSLYESGNTFIRACEDTSSKAAEMLQLTCLGYVNGVIDGADVLTQFFAEPSKKGAHAFCTDSSVTYGQKYRVVIKYIKDHPEKSHQQTRLLTIEAMLEAFPCHDH